MSDPIPPPAWWQRRSDQDRNSSYDMSSGILATGLISLALVVAVLVFLHLYVRYVLRRRYPRGGGRRSLTTAMDLFRFNTAVDQPPGGAGLDPAAISALPSFPYRKTNDEEEEEASGVGGPECAVCLSAVEEGEMVRRLPACKHVFHVGCIDMWLASHVTCPVCRATVEPTPADSAVVEVGEPSRPAAAAAKWASQEGPSGTKEGGSASFSFDLSASLKRMVSRSRSSSSHQVQEETTEDLPQEGPSRTKEGGSASFNFDLSTSLKRMVSRNRSSSSQQAQEETTEDLPQEGPSETKEGASPSFRFDLSASLKRMVSRSRSSSSQQVQEETKEDVPPNLERL
ncbi:uncharacterized protein LOC141825644 [Curcuma longa]|uniref:uncharacterized protein LOC141825644 n=1 Tax=Curcuma longa TaxID=136217 RepID=UPI003D9E96BD